MKHPKLLIFLAIIVMLSGLLLVAAYNNLSYNGFQVNSSEQIPPPPQLQINSPPQNATFNSTKVPVPLNITANNATAKITYSLDGGENVTLIEYSSMLPCLSYGVHNITVYGFDIEGKVGDFKIIIFTLVYPWAPLKLTMEQVQETINYFEARGLTVQILDTSKPQNCLYYKAIHLQSKEDLANCAIAKGINVIDEVLDLNTNYVGFCADYYDIPVLPTVYTYAATLIK